jgi:two-component system LytT family response regulator
MLPFFFIRHKGRLVKLITADIRYIEASKNYAKIYTGSQLFVTLATLQRLEAALPPEEFIRIHRSFLVSVSHLTGFDRRCVYLEGRHLPIGDTYYASLLHRFAVIGSPEPRTPVRKLPQLNR